MAWPSVYGLDTARFQQETPPPPPAKPTLLLVHDAFHAATHLAPLAERLEAAGFRVVRPQLPSAAAMVPPAQQQTSNALEADIRTLITYGKAEIDLARHVVIVAHGYGCVPAGVAADRLNQYSLDRPRTGEVKKLIMIAGVVLRPGDSFEAVLEPEWMIEHDDELVRVHRPSQVFFQDCAGETAARAVAQIRAQEPSSFNTTVARPGWTQIPTLYIVCELDNAIASETQLEFVRTLQAANRRTAVVRVQSGHCPFLSRTLDLTSLIARGST